MIHAKWFVLTTEFPAGRHLEMWCCCVAVPDSTRSLLLFLSRVETNIQRIDVTFQDGGPKEIQWSKQIAWRELHTENYQIWAADVDIRSGKLLFETDITAGHPRFPLRSFFQKKIEFSELLSDKVHKIFL